MPVIIPPAFKAPTVLQYFDDTYWTANIGYWNVDHWEKNFFDDRIDIQELGTWVEGFRPSSVDMTMQLPNGFNSTNVIVDVIDTNSATIGTITMLPAEGTGVLNKNITLTFTSFDIQKIVMSGDPFPDFEIQNIVFNP